eukprot:TRINITY_DN49457_c0_g1_i1.p1 TRINITY_DN49457_c0_g1~~TRINITY_DN49457_c0_g1_i1.p1  ORF type:complete len:333 (-),score=49.66 TRINITY_DN49457_c0_g1_i1:71-1006(-)
MAASEDPPPPLPFAHASDLVRAHQKDEVCRGLLRRAICEAHEELAGHRAAARWQSAVANASDLAYVVATSVLAGRTLGEEYCELLPVTPAASLDGRLLRPARLRRLIAGALSILQVFLPSLLRSWAASARTPRWQSLLSTAADAAPLALRLHLAIFYLFGRFRHVADRAVHTRYVSLSERPYRNFSYRALGVLLLAQIAGELYSRRAKRRREQSEAILAASAAEAVAAMSQKKAQVHPGAALLLASDPDKQPTCRICFCPATCTTAATCGHLYCWECIATWCATKPSCPYCRAHTPPQQLLPLNHYEMAPS